MRLERRLAALCLLLGCATAPRPGDPLPPRSTCSSTELLTFVADPAVPPDNNLAERSLRPRSSPARSAGGSRSAAGMRPPWPSPPFSPPGTPRAAHPLAACRQLLLALEALELLRRPVRRPAAIVYGGLRTGEVCRSSQERGWWKDQPGQVNGKALRGTIRADARGPGSTGSNSGNTKSLLGSALNLASVRNRFAFARSTNSPGGLDLRLSKDIRQFGFAAFSLEDPSGARHDPR